MLQAHTFLWNYLWVAPNVLLLLLAFLLFRNKTSQHLPVFFAFALVSGIGDLALYAADLAPSVTNLMWWRLDWGVLVIEGLLKFVVIGEIFSRLLDAYPSLSRLGRFSISSFGIALVTVATLVAAYSRGDSSEPLISGFHIIEQTIFIVELGLVVLVFCFAAYFRLSWDRASFGLLLGFGISSCGHLAAWAIMTNADPSAHGRVLLDLLNMAIHHVCVLIWGYYLLVPGKVPAKLAAPLPETNLDLWNRELERLLQQ